MGQWQAQLANWMKQWMKVWVKTTKGFDLLIAMQNTITRSLLLVLFACLKHVIFQCVHCSKWLTCKCLSCLFRSPEEQARDEGPQRNVWLPGHMDCWRRRWWERRGRWREQWRGRRRWRHAGRGHGGRGRGQHVAGLKYSDDSAFPQVVVEDYDKWSLKLLPVEGIKNWYCNISVFIFSTLKLAVMLKNLFLQLPVINITLQDLIYSNIIQVAFKLLSDGFSGQFFFFLAFLNLMSSVFRVVQLHTWPAVGASQQLRALSLFSHCLSLAHSARLLATTIVFRATVPREAFCLPVLWTELPVWTKGGADHLFMSSAAWKEAWEALHLLRLHYNPKLLLACVWCWCAYAGIQLFFWELNNRGKKCFRWLRIIIFMLEMLWIGPTQRASPSYVWLCQSAQRCGNVSSLMVCFLWGSQCPHKPNIWKMNRSWNRPYEDF